MTPKEGTEHPDSRLSGFSFECQVNGEWNNFTSDNVWCRPINCGLDFDTWRNEYEMSILIGLFPWSNFSMDVFLEVVTNSQWFLDANIGVGVTCLGSPHQAKDISELLYKCLLTAHTEPLILCLSKMKLLGRRAGRQTFFEIRDWLTSFEQV